MPLVRPNAPHRVFQDPPASSPPAPAPSRTPQRATPPLRCHAKSLAQLRSARRARHLDALSLASRCLAASPHPLPPSPPSGHARPHVPLRATRSPPSAPSPALPHRRATHPPPCPPRPHAARQSPPCATPAPHAPPLSRKSLTHSRLTHLHPAACASPRSCALGTLLHARACLMARVRRRCAPRGRGAGQRP